MRSPLTLAEFALNCPAMHYPEIAAAIMHVRRELVDIAGDLELCAATARTAEDAQAFDAKARELKRLAGNHKPTGWTATS